MKIVRTCAELGTALLARKGPVFFVPTMGSLHNGHLSLLQMAHQERDATKPRGSVVMSLFVNPKQFNSALDLDAYPRDEERDAHLASRAGCDVLFAPSVAEIYPSQGGDTAICVRGVSEPWEGKHRPGHFDGVATVVAKLFHTVLPDYAYFGEKDWQQCRVIEQMVFDLNFPVWIRFGRTVRESDGLAMSSRNDLLTPIERPRAPALFDALSKVAEGVRSGKPPRDLECDAEQRVLRAGFQSVDYIAVVDEDSLVPVVASTKSARVLGAATLGNVRLIDNVRVH